MDLEMVMEEIGRKENDENDVTYVAIAKST